MTDPTVLALLERIADDVRAIRAAVDRRRPPDGDHRHALLEPALLDRFGAGDEVTVAALLALTAADPHCRLSVALSQAVDLGADGAAARLGLLLARLPCLELQPYKRRGAAAYRLREADEG